MLNGEDPIFSGLAPVSLVSSNGEGGSSSPAWEDSSDTV